MARKQASVVGDILPKLKRLRLLTRCERDLGLPKTTLKHAATGKRGLPIKYWDQIREWAKENLKGDLAEGTYIKKPEMAKGIKDFLKSKINNNEDSSGWQGQRD